MARGTINRGTINRGLTVHGQKTHIGAEKPAKQRPSIPARSILVPNGIITILGAVGHCSHSEYQKARTKFCNASLHGMNITDGSCVVCKWRGGAVTSVSKIGLETEYQTNLKENGLQGAEVAVN